MGTGTWGPDAAWRLILTPGWPHLAAATFGVEKNFPLKRCWLCLLVPGREEGNIGGRQEGLDAALPLGLGEAEPRLAPPLPGVPESRQESEAPTGGHEAPQSKSEGGLHVLQLRTLALLFHSCQRQWGGSSTAKSGQVPLPFLDHHQALPEATEGFIPLGTVQFAQTHVFTRASSMENPGRLKPA